MTLDLDDGLVILLQHQRYGFQGIHERRLDRRLVQVEGDIARHHQLNLVAVAHHPYAAAFKLAAQLGFLLVHVVADTTTDGGATGRANQGSLAAVTLAGGGGANGGAANGADNAAFGGA